MPDLSHQERLQPSLLDRLVKDPAREQRILNEARLREAVIRDLGWLLNTTSLASAVDLEEAPHVRSSVLNYGVPELAGATTTTIDLQRLEAAVRRAICDFEPRILAQTVRVTAMRADEASHNALSFVIEGQLWGQPLPLPLFIKTEIDLESGEVTIDDSGTGG